MKVTAIEIQGDTQTARLAIQGEELVVSYGGPITDRVGLACLDDSDRWAVADKVFEQIMGREPANEMESGRIYDCVEDLA